MIAFGKPAGNREVAPKEFDAPLGGPKPERSRRDEKRKRKRKRRRQSRR